MTGCANDLHGPYFGPDGWIYWCKGAFARQTYERAGRPPLATRASHIFRARPDGTAPCLLYGYGAYESCDWPEFSVATPSLLDRGFVYATAHVRGGGEMGRSWYTDGKLLRKKNTFTDFIACARHLAAQGWTSPARSLRC